MAQTKKKRRSKHRGNAAGVVEARGRTGRKPTEEERKTAAKADARQDRMMKPPTWRSAVYRSAAAAVIFGLLVVIAFKKPAGQGIALTCFVFVLYIPLGYYTDAFMYKRRVKLEAAKKKTKAKS